MIEKDNMFTNINLNSFINYLLDEDFCLQRYHIDHKDKVLQWMGSVNFALLGNRSGFKNVSS